MFLDSGKIFATLT